MKLLAALAVSVLAAKPVPIKIQAAQIGNTGGLNQARIGLPLLAPTLNPTLNRGPLQNLTLTPGVIDLTPRLNDFNAQTVQFGKTEAETGGGENEVSSLAQLESAAKTADVSLTFDGYKQEETLEEAKPGMFARFIDRRSAPEKAGIETASLPAPAPLAMGPLKRKNSRWTLGGRPLKKLGHGTIGTVEVHPNYPGLIVKTIEPSFDQLFMGLTYEVASEADNKAAETLASAGVGPKVIGSAVVAGRRVSVRERVFGKTMQELADKKLFGEKEEGLVHDMLRRMAAANTLVTDLKPENIMIGHTEKDHEVKAWFIDGGMVEELPAGLDLEGRYQKILNFPNVVAVRQDMNSGRMIESYRTLESYLQDERDRRAMKPWRYFVKSVWDAYMRGGAGMGMPK